MQFSERLRKSHLFDFLSRPDSRNIPSIPRETSDGPSVVIPTDEERRRLGAGRNPVLNPIERRCEVRMPFVAVTKLTAWGSNNRLEALTSDLSSHGCFVATTNPSERGQKVWLSIAYAGLKVGAVGNVAHVSEEGMGIIFSKLQMLDRNRVAEWLDFLRAEVAGKE